MKSLTEYLTLNLPSRMAFKNITTEVEDVVRNSKVQEGILLCNAMHITASVFINDDEPGLHEDYKRWLELVAPLILSARYSHNRTGEDNADAHMKRQIMAERLSSQSLAANLTSVRGNRSSTVNSTAASRKGY